MRPCSWRSPEDATIDRWATIALKGRVVTLLPQGAREVRLDNGHLMTADAASGGPPRPSALGDRVTIELPTDRVTGWRLATA